MKKTSLKAVVEVFIKSIICPNTRLDSSKWVHLRVSMLGCCVRSRLLKAQFPLKVDEKMRFERTFPLCSSASHLYSALAGEKLRIELVQLNAIGSKVLALMSANLNDFIFDSPSVIKEKEVRTDNYSVILHTTHHFPGIANPYVSVVMTIKLLPVHDCKSEISRDGGFNFTLGLKGCEFFPNYSPYWDESTYPTIVPSLWPGKTYPLRTCQKALLSKVESPKTTKPPKRQIFCVRHVDDQLIGRKPSSEFLPVNRDYGQRPSSHLARTVKPSWMKNSSQMDTVSSLLRKNPKVVRSVKYEEDEDKSGWYTYDHSPTTSSRSSSDVHNLEKKNQRSNDLVTKNTSDDQHIENDSDNFHNHDSLRYLNNHNSEICTLCQLYYEYFGQIYPMHL